jgi:hypothetical protein
MKLKIWNYLTQIIKINIDTKHYDEPRLEAGIPATGGGGLESEQTRSISFLNFF